MLKTKSKLDWCLSNKDRLRKIPPNSMKAGEHIEKAKHNLLAADYNVKGGFDDWAVSQCYYAMYHGLLAILFKFGYESNVNKEILNNLVKRAKEIVEKIEIIIGG